MTAVVIYHELSAELRSLIKQKLPELDVHVAPDELVLKDILSNSDILIAGRVPLHVFADPGKLRWFQCVNAGVDFLTPIRDQLKRIIVTNARGIHGAAMADYAMGVITFMLWDFRRFLVEQAKKEWNTRYVFPLNKKTLTVVGLGAIGSEVVKRAVGAGMRVIGVNRSGDHRSSESCEIFAVEKLNSALAQSDFVVAVVPATVDTHAMFGQAQFRAMKKGAFFINMARGSVVDEKALLEALKDGSISGAALDVFAIEPLPADSPFWDMKNVIITPHMAGNPANYPELIVDIFKDNYHGFVRGSDMRNVVNFDKGY